jgi:hypothetical protein
LTDAIIHILNYASQGLQETCLVFALPGFFVWVFGKKVKPVTYTKQAKRSAKRGRNAVPKKAVVKRDLRTEKPKKAKAKKAKQIIQVEYSPEDIWRVDEYRVKRDRK